MTLTRTRFFPLRRQPHAAFKYDVIIGIGGNVGDVNKRFRHLFRQWMDDRRLWVVETSPILKNPPFGFLDQDDFFNGVMYLQTSLDAFRLLRLLQQSEKRFGRVRSFKDAPRTLDLDIIFFNRQSHHRKHLRIPHPHWSERNSVVIPLGLMSTI